MHRHPYLYRFNDNAEVFLSHPDYPFKHVRQEENPLAAAMLLTEEAVEKYPWLEEQL